MLLLVLQKYEISSKSQLLRLSIHRRICCCWYCKSTKSQANHNVNIQGHQQTLVVAGTAKVRNLKQITTDGGKEYEVSLLLLVLQKYEISSKSQLMRCTSRLKSVVAGTAKVRNLKQITTCFYFCKSTSMLLLVLQKYEISSKSQPNPIVFVEKLSCCWYCKSTKSQANHNQIRQIPCRLRVVAGTAKVRNLKQITTVGTLGIYSNLLLLVLQKYEISSKSQRYTPRTLRTSRCCWYCKSTKSQANHNNRVGIIVGNELLLVLQKYEISSKSQLTIIQQILG